MVVKTKKPETKMQREKRLGPIRAIVRWIANPKPRATTQIAVLECGHGRALPRGPRKTFRCNQCKIEKARGAPVLSRYAKALRATGKREVTLKRVKVAAAKPARKAKPKAKPRPRPRPTPAPAPAAQAETPRPVRTAVPEEPVVVRTAVPDEPERVDSLAD